ncbi:multiple epidermal growth factor-like domains protein 6 [Mercenaria mercenaria]|uniref:multiple epidermal growth factor-like domains protein 6 n=1 Tax=Mercenaria mercenaria TaxID=6596 RepID=UPI00234FAF86|nr:multiple epidermal growth factor-like domains protein 6 [Mercenaria mercenaria]
MIRYVLMCLALLLVGIDLFLTGEVIDSQCQVNRSCCVNQLCGRIEKLHYFGNNSCLKGCIDGYKGTRCYVKCAEYCKACSCLNSNNCTKCPEGFYNGKYKNCSENCASNCKACGKGPDLCTKCHEGFYNGKYKNCSEECPAGCKGCKSQESCSDYNGNNGKFCDRQCPPNCKNVICDKLSGNCSYGCITDEFIGSKCNDCVTGKYGTFCNKSCPTNCKGDKCNKTNGVCLNGCKENFAGKTCSACVAGKYSLNCGVNCSRNCENQLCEFTSGNCLKCKDNYFGKHCDKCKIGYYGSECNGQCPPNCLYGVCDRETGSCLAGCKDGFSGNKCCLNNSYCIECSSNINCSRCLSGFYSHNCLSRCPCDGNPCEQINGKCIIGKGTDSEKTCSPCEKVADRRMLVGFSISTLLLLICIAVLVIILLRRTRPCQRHRKQQDQAGGHVKNKVEMTEISATEAENVKGCGRTSSSEKPYEDLHEERDAGREHQYLEIAIQNEDSTGDT